MATFAVEVWSWKLFQILDPLVFGAAIRRSVYQNNKIFGLFWGALGELYGTLNPPMDPPEVYTSLI